MFLLHSFEALSSLTHFASASLVGTGASVTLSALVKPDQSLSQLGRVTFGFRTTPSSGFSLSDA